jgi:hypothetical protein
MNHKCSCSYHFVLSQIWCIHSVLLRRHAEAEALVPHLRLGEGSLTDDSPDAAAKMYRSFEEVQQGGRGHLPTSV